MIDIALDHWLTFQLFERAKQSEKYKEPKKCLNCNSELEVINYNLNEYFTKGFLHKFCSNCGFHWTKRIVNS